jgi:hypothetical protein
VTMALTAGREWKRERSQSRSPLVSRFFSRWRVNPYTASGSGDGEWSKPAATIPVTRKFPTLFPSPNNFFQIIFYLWNVYFVIFNVEMCI